MAIPGMRLKQRVGLILKDLRRNTTHGRVVSGYLISISCHATNTVGVGVSYSNHQQNFSIVVSASEEFWLQRGSMPRWRQRRK